MMPVPSHVVSRTVAAGLAMSVLLGAALAADDAHRTAANTASQTAALAPPIVGTWTVIFDFNCDGNPGTGAWYVNADGSYSDNAGNTGTWVQNGKFLRLTYSNRSFYDGKLKSKKVALGRIFDAEGGDIGCWKARR